MKAMLIVLLGMTFLFPPPNIGTRTSQTAGLAAPQTSAQKAAMDELNEAARYYREGNFAEAQEHAERALALDPLSETAPILIARTIHAQYHPEDLKETNLTKAREAIAAYKRILARNPHDEEAYTAVGNLYLALKEDELFRQWVFQRAIDPTFSAEKRAADFVSLASRHWFCSFEITELPANQTTVSQRSSRVTRYTKPKNLAEFKKAQDCADHGLAFIDSAIALNPASEAAWVFKMNLLREMSKLAEMDRKLALKDRYDKQAVVARRTTEELAKKRQNSSATKP